MNFLDIVKSTFPPVVVFGASVVGKIILDSLEILDIQPVCFCDNDAAKQQKPFHGYEVISFEKLCIEHPDAVVVIAAGRYYNDIRQQLLDAGFKKIFRDSDVISCIDFRKTSGAKFEKIIWYLAKLGKLSEIWDIPENSLHIPRLNVVITSRCTLRCEQCSSLIPYYPNTSDFQTVKIITSLEKIFNSADLVYHVEILGGEPFLNRDLSIVTRFLLDSGKVLHIDIITNGTILPSNSTLLSLRHEQVTIVIDDYGKLSAKKEMMTNVLNRLEIDYRINKHWAWADLGGFEYRNRDQLQLTELFKRCNFNSCSELLDGRLHRCPRSSHGLQTTLIPDYPEDFIDILNVEEDEKSFKEKMRVFFYNKEFLHACNHCNGNNSESLTLTPAIQQNSCSR